MPVPIPKATPVPDHFILPDLVSHCNFPLAYHPHGDDVAAESVRWLDEGCPELSPKARKALYGLQAGELTAYCYPFCSTERLRVVSDFMNYLFHLDNVSDGMMRKGTEELADCVMNALWFPDRYMPTACEGKEQPMDEVSAGKLARECVPSHSLMTVRSAQRCKHDADGAHGSLFFSVRSYWTRCTRDAKPGPQARFKESLELFFEAVHQQARDRDSKLIPDLDSYVSVSVMRSPPGAGGSRPHVNHSDLAGGSHSCSPTGPA